MSLHVIKDNHPIDKETRLQISNRYKRITRAINKEFWSNGILFTKYFEGRNNYDY